MLDGAPPPIFRQGVSAFSRLIFFCALALFLMVADVRFKMMSPLRTGVVVVLYPFQWMAMQPIIALRYIGDHFKSLASVQNDLNGANAKLTAQMQKTGVVEQLQIENHRLRELLQLQQRPETSGRAAEVIYDAADPFTRKVVIEKGSQHNMVVGSPVLDEFGVVGQITRVHPLTSEVTLLINKDQAIPVLNTRTGARSVAYGSAQNGNALELRFMAANADVLQGDLLTTSGIDGVYPAGIPVAKIDKIERRADTAFAKIYCTPVAQVVGATHVMVLQPLTPIQSNTLLEVPPATSHKKGKL